MAPHQNEANPWYGLMRWKKRRRAQLRKHPLCKICLESRGLVVPACVVDHVVPHGGDRKKFEFGALQSLCKQCHDSVKHTIDQRGYSTEIGADGWPIDERHPTWKGKGRSIV
jgi:5-methylcytosine-specific restriction endonuclease McrA